MGAGSKQVERGAIATSFIHQHACVAAIDKALGWLLICGMIFTEVLSTLMALSLFADGVTAFELMNMGASACALSIAGLAFILWHSLVYYDPRMRKLMSTPTSITPNGFMRAGFLPIPAAASVGVLLFVTSAFISVGVMEGSMLKKATAGDFLAWLPGKACRACSVQDSNYVLSWTARMDRTAPWPVETASSFQDYFHGKVNKFNKGEGACFNAGLEFGMADVIETLPDGTTVDRDIPNLLHPTGDTDGHVCMYECAMWQTINLRTVIDASGSISIGAGIVVLITASVSSKLGLATVTESTSPEQLLYLVKKASPGSMLQRLAKPFQASMTGAALPIVIIGAVLKYYLVTKIDADGYFTVDYYVVFVLLYSAVMVTLLRVWHPFECRPQIYTKKIWEEGHGNFIVNRSIVDGWDADFGVGEFHRVRDVGQHLVLVYVDLYQWMHLRGNERAKMLIDYCRRADKGGGSKDGGNTILVTLSECEVTVTHNVPMKDGEEINTEKQVTLPQGTELKMVSWKDDDRIVVSWDADGDGKDEQLVMCKYEVVEKSKEWDEAIAKMQKFLNIELRVSVSGVSASALGAGLLSNEAGAARASR